MAKSYFQLTVVNAISSILPSLIAKAAAGGAWGYKKNEHSVNGGGFSRIS
jgi:hypothetical protein